MPLILGNNGIDLLLWNLRTQSYNYQPYAIYGNLIKDLVTPLIKCIFPLNLFNSIRVCLAFSKGIQQHTTYYGSVDDTIITIEDDESTPLLLERIVWSGNNSYNNNKNYEMISFNKKPILKKDLSSWTFDSSDQSNSSNSSADCTKSFKSHFMELKVLAFALILAVAISIAIYLLIIESRLPSITLSLDLVSHDIWSGRIIPKYKHLHHNNVDHIILMQTGNRNCDTSMECLEVLTELQNNNPIELPYNFLIGGDGQAYEVRGWKYQSSIEGIPQAQSLVIGIIGNFAKNFPKNSILRTIKSLIQVSCKRHMINRKYYIYGLLRNDHDRKETKNLYSKIKEWPQFKGLLLNF